MYRVHIYKGFSVDTVDRRDFPYGKWQEIGYWLDDLGYNGADYRVVIYFFED